MRITFAATAAAVLGLVLAGCAAPAPAPTLPAGSLGVTAPAASETPSAGPDDTGDLSVDEFIEKFSGAYRQVKTYAMEMKITSGEAGVISASGVVDQSGDSPAQHTKMTAMGMDMEVIQLDGVIYMLIASLSQDWIRMTPEQAAQQGIDLPSSPDQMIAQAGDSFEAVEFIGTEDVGGVPTEHYKITLAPDAVDEAGAALSGYDVWLDEIGFTRRVLIEAAGDGDGGTFSTELLTTRVNEPVSIEAPQKWVEMPS